ncbi:hypothetical protein DFO73_10914 [Cytobacillus oceanisediminis]|jgi:hypothetical protein|uniref:Uncharacterized protein n=1 Tax=Cytobacillus oceanisediminis TaxID=665099 RepID=A0A2V3A026_9BACI|nr:hypothetical protein DFO73_10914 [Cytobacillus oceanisediminis]
MKGLGLVLVPLFNLFNVKLCTRKLPPPNAVVPQKNYPKYPPYYETILKLYKEIKDKKKGRK